jgi:hypothetical protein
LDAVGATPSSPRLGRHAFGVTDRPVGRPFVAIALNLDYF